MQSLKINMIVLFSSNITKTLHSVIPINNLKFNFFLNLNNNKIELMFVKYICIIVS